MKNKLAMIMLPLIVFVTVLQVNATRSTAFVKGETDEGYESDIQEEEGSEIEVSDIEINEFEEEMVVGGTQSIAAEILPPDATNQNIEYTSTNPEVATITSTGKITALAKGQTKIIIKAGEIVKDLTLTVKVATDMIAVDEKYLVLKVGSNYRIKARVLPPEAEQSLTYRCTGEDVISVNRSGLIKARNVGAASVIISNGDAQRAIAVIVNRYGQSDGADKMVTQAEKQDVIPLTDPLLDILVASIEDTIYYEANGGVIISKTVLKYLYESKKSLVVLHDGYSVTVRRAMICSSTVCANG